MRTIIDLKVISESENNLILKILKRFRKFDCLYLPSMKTLSNMKGYGYEISELVLPNIEDFKSLRHIQIGKIKLNK